MNTTSKYDVAIIGGGIGGLMTAYRLKETNPKLEIVILEKGNALTNRKCPAQKGKPCAKCKVCSITSGYAGAGAFSDGKFCLGTSYGGTLGEELGETKAMYYMKQVDGILKEYSEGDYPEVYGSDEGLKLKCLQNNLRLLDMDVRHLGTDRNYKIMDNFISKLEELGVHLESGIDVENVVKIDRDGYAWGITYTVLKHNTIDSLRAKNIVFAVGRNGSEFLQRFCKNNGIKITSNAVDIGVRVEMPDSIWADFSSKIYEPKILCKTTTFEDKTRMFCFNQGGVVSAENNDGIITANGHSYANPEKKTKNCNFAVLTSIKFTEPFDEPTTYAKNIAHLANLIGAGNVIVQRLGDLVRGRRTNAHRLNQNSVKPTLTATPGDLSLVLPHRILVDIIETLYALDKVAPGTANDDTLLYGCECKYYSVKPEIISDFSIAENAWVVGDCSGICRGLAQSAAMGLYVGDMIIEGFEDVL